MNRERDLTRKNAGFFVTYLTNNLPAIDCLPLYDTINTSCFGSLSKGVAMLVHSYARFSDPSQEAGDSLRRQQDATIAFCKRKGWTLSDLRFQDLGRSGFKGNKQRALAEFEKAVDDGRVKPGDVLLVENVDRLSRKGIRQTQNLVNRLLDAGINIAILTPVEKVYRSGDENDIGGAIELAAYAFQAHIYSENLSNRIKSFNENRRAGVRKGEPKLLSAVTPSWLERLPDGKFKAKAEAVKAIRYIFKRTIEGIGRKRLLAEVNEQFKPLSSRKNSHSWNETLLAKLITSRAVLGELKSTVTGETFKEYYPAILDETTWIKANGEARKRRTERGPSSQRVNLFNGILFHSVDNCAMGFYSYTQQRAKGPAKKFCRYKSYLATHGVNGASRETVDVEVFEDLIFKFLPQLELGKRKGDKQAALRAERDYIYSEIEAMQKQIISHETSAAVLVGPLSAMSAQLKAIEEKLKSEAVPTVEPTRPYREKLAAMKRGTVEQRLLVRDRIRDIVQRIEVLPIKLGTFRRDRVRCLIEVEFKNGEFARGLELESGVTVMRGPKIQQRLSEQIKSGWTFTAKDYAKAVKLFGKAVSK